MQISNENYIGHQNPLSSCRIYSLAFKSLHVVLKERVELQWHQDIRLEFSISSSLPRGPNNLSITSHTLSFLGFKVSLALLLHTSYHIFLLGYFPCLYPLGIFVTCLVFQKSIEIWVIWKRTVIRKRKKTITLFSRYYKKYALLSQCNIDILIYLE